MDALMRHASLSRYGTNRRPGSVRLADCFVSLLRRKSRLSGGSADGCKLLHDRASA